MLELLGNERCLINRHPPDFFGTKPIGDIFELRLASEKMDQSFYLALLPLTNSILFLNYKFELKLNYVQSLKPLGLYNEVETPH